MGSLSDLRGSLGVLRRSVGVPGASSGGSEASLGVAASATDRFDMYTEGITFFLGSLPAATNIIGRTTSQGVWALLTQTVICI